MNSHTATLAQTRTLEVPGATLAYDIREPEKKSTEPTLLLIGSPMDASGFTSLAGPKPVVFASHHGGFMGGEFGWPGKPEEFAAKLREVLSGKS